MEITSLGNEAGYQQNVLSYTENNFCCDELENKSLNGGPVPSRLLLGSFLLKKSDIERRPSHDEIMDIKLCSAANAQIT